MTDDIKTDINGLGKRITKTEICMAQLETKTVRNEQDIQKIYDAIQKIPVWIVISVAVPTLLLAYQIFLK